MPLNDGRWNDPRVPDLCPLQGLERRKQAGSQLLQQRPTWQINAHLQILQERVVPRFAELPHVDLPHVSKQAMCLKLSWTACVT